MYYSLMQTRETGKGLYNYFRILPNVLKSLNKMPFSIFF